MTTAAAIHATEVILNAVSLVQDIPLSRIRESKTNPIRQFDETRLAELADKITLRGVLQPILVHPLPGGEAESYNSSPGHGDTVLQSSRSANPFPLQSASSPIPNASNCNSSKTSNAPTYTNWTKPVATQPSCTCNRTPAQSKL
jgi:hypothetical protein